MSHLILPSADMRCPLDRASASIHSGLSGKHGDLAPVPDRGSRVDLEQSLFQLVPGPSSWLGRRTSLTCAAVTVVSGPAGQTSVILGTEENLVRLQASVRC
jgi:hypothetical protein